MTTPTVQAGLVRAGLKPALADHERTRCEVWSRVMGYHRPVSSWNIGKQQEHRDRLFFREPGPDDLPPPAGGFGTGGFETRPYPWPADPADD